MNDDINMTPPPWAPAAAAPPSGRRMFGLGSRTAGVITAVGLATGGLAGGFIISHAATSPSPTPSTAPSTGTGSTAPSGGTTAPVAPNGAATGTFHSNEDPTHEAGESAQREAEENSGHFPGPPPAANGTAPSGTGTN